MSEKVVKFAMIHIGGDIPDPYILNDALNHVGGDVEFGWVRLEGGYTPTHYIAYNETISFLPVSPEHLAEYAVTAELCAQHICEGEILTAKSEMDRAGIGEVDTETDANEVKFTLANFPDIWIHVLWLA